MSETTLLESRLSKIERDNRRLKLALGALLLALAAVPLIGAVMPEQIPEVIQARAFLAMDENGNPRSHMSGLGISYRDENGTERTVMSEDGISYFDENRNTRARLGRVGLVTPSTGAETTYPAQVVLFDPEGNTIWEALGGR